MLNQWTVALPANVDPAIPKEYASFITSGEVALKSLENCILITILRDTGTVQSLILKNYLAYF